MSTVPIIPAPDGSARRTLTDADGVPLARYTHAERDGGVVADQLELEVPLERAVPVLIRALEGMRVSGSEALGRALLAAGARPGRHAHVYSHDLRERPAIPAGFELTPLDRPASALLAAYRAAHPREHVDWPLIEHEDSLAHLSMVLAGGLGPILDCSGLAIAGGRVVGAILVAEATDVPPPVGGPWVMELFRAPDAPGAGRALLERALALCEGPTLGLTVTEGNHRAVRLYEALGFERVWTAFSVEL
jgi:ribosomal protein S18 acetylase RimI-like enzyme